MTTAIKMARRWHEWRLGERRVIRTITVSQIHSQVGKMRARRPECNSWRWTTRTVEGGILVERVR